MLGLGVGVTVSVGVGVGDGALGSSRKMTIQSSEGEEGGVPSARFPPPVTVAIAPSKYPLRGLNHCLVNTPGAVVRLSAPLGVYLDRTYGNVRGGN